MGSLKLDWGNIQIQFNDDETTNLKIGPHEFTAHHAPGEVIENLVDYCYSVATTQEELESFLRDARLHCGRYLFDRSMVENLADAIQGVWDQKAHQSSISKGNLVSILRKSSHL